jgi:nitrite reductase (NO-forming)
MQPGAKGIAALAALTLLLSSCARAPSTEAPITPAGLVLAGQRTVCGSGPRHRTFRISAARALVDLGSGYKTETWTYGGTLPGPVMEACEDDTVTITMPNQDTDPVMGTDHGLDTHAFQIDAAKYNAVGPGRTLEFTAKVEVPGVFMYHCAVGPATDWHMKAGMYGAMIVYPRKSLQEAKELLVVQSALYGAPDASHSIVQTTDRAEANDPFVMMFNGKLEHQPVTVKAGELVRIYFVNVGPGNSAVHVIGSILERFSISGNPKNMVYDVQTESVPPGGGATFEFRPPKGLSVLVDHNNLRYLEYNFAIAFNGE